MVEPLRPKRRSFINQVAHLFRGSVVYAGAQWCMLAMLAFFGSDEEAGKYVFALATTAPLFMLFDLNLRVVRSTDHRHNERFASYLGLRTICLVLASTLAIVLAAIFFPSRFWIFAGVIGFRIGDSLSNLSYGGFQRVQQSDLIGKSLTFKGIVILICIAIGAWISGGSAIVASAIMAAIALTFALAVDLRSAWKSNEPNQPLNLSIVASSIRDTQSSWRITKRAIPLGFDSFVSSLSLNVPRYCIEGFLGTAALGVYGLLFQLAFSLQMLLGAVGHTGVSILSDSYRNNQPERFWGLFNKMLISSITIGAAVVLIGTLMPFLFGSMVPAQYNRPTVIFFLLLASCLAGAQRTAGRATQACGKYMWYTLFDVIIFTVSLAASLALINSYGLVGAAITLVAAFGGGLIATLLHTYSLLWRDNIPPKTH